MTKHLIGVRHDGAGRYPRQTVYTTDPESLARAEAADPGHAHPVYEYQPDGCANRCRTAAEALSMERRYAR